MSDGRADPDEKLIRMANQIARFMETKPHDEGVKGVAGHINDYWEPRMREKFLALASGDPRGEEIRPLVRDALPLIRRPVAEPG